MYSAVFDETIKRNSSNLSSYRVKTGQKDRLGSIINNIFNTVAASSALIFLPSLPMILPFISSLGRLTVEIV